MFKITTVQSSIIISMLALLISGLHIYFGFLRKGSPKFICSSFTALGMENKEDGSPRSAFATKIQISIMESVHMY